MNLEDEKQILKDEKTLREFLRRLWRFVEKRVVTQQEALDRLDGLATVEIKGECRGGIMDILDKASMLVGGRKPTITDTEDGEYRIPIGLAGQLDEVVEEAEETSEKPKNIIQI